jgi:hypothetical protein
VAGGDGFAHGQLVGEAQHPVTVSVTITGSDSVTVAVAVTVAVTVTVTSSDSVAVSSSDSVAVTVTVTSPDSVAVTVAVAGSDSVAVTVAVSARVRQPGSVVIRFVFTAGPQQQRYAQQQGEHGAAKMALHGGTSWSTPYHLETV